jgi:O-antigen/teichoic acid export membrane protein
MSSLNRVVLLSAGLIGVLALVGLGVLIWRRFYRDDPANTARRIFKNSAVPFALRLFVRGLDMVFAFVLYGLLPAAEIGRYDFAALLVVQYLGTITEFGLGVLLTREVAREPDAARRLFGVTLALRLALVLAAAVPATALLIGGYGLLGSIGAGEPISPEGQAALWILLLTLLPSAYSGAVTALYQAREQMEVPALIELVSAVLNFLARLAAVLLGFGVLGLAWAAVIVSSLTAVIFFNLQRRVFFPPSLNWDRTVMRWMVPAALPLMLNNLLGAVFFRFDTYIVKAFGGGQGDQLVAQYGLAYKVIGIAMVLPPAVTFAVFPLLARKAGGERSAMHQAQSRTLGLLLILAFPIAAGISVLARDLVWIFTRDEFEVYRIAIPALAILAWFLPLSFANGLLQYVLIAIDRQRAITRAFMIGAAFNLLSNLIAIPIATNVYGRPEWGIYAAALITILSEVVLYLVFRPLLHQEQLVPGILKRSWRPFLAAAGMGLAMLALMSAIGGWLASLAAALLAPAIYLGLLWALGGIGVEERLLVQRILGRSS